MIPVVTVEEMQAIDASAPDATEVLVQRAGGAVAREARRRLHGGYGRRVVVVAGKGNNGADGRVAGERLRRWGVRVVLLEASSEAAGPGRPLPPCDLVIDAAYGTGFRGRYCAPDPGGAPVLAVDIPSGVAGDTGEAAEEAVRADATVAFAALKPGLVLGEGPERAGEVEVADIGLDVSRSTISVVERHDVGWRLPARPRHAHKWQSAVWVVAGSPGMMGAAWLCSRGAMRAGAGMVRLGSPGVAPADLLTGETVGRPLPAEGWESEVLGDLGRCRALVLGPGLGRAETTVSGIRRLVAESPLPAVVDADGLYALGSAEEAASVLRGREIPAVITPHDGEFARLAGSPPGPRRIDDVRALAARLGAVVLLKGATTVVADPEGRVLLATAGDSRLATAGTGDVLAGIIGAFLALGLDTSWAAASAAFVHGSAAGLGYRWGMVAGDLLDMVPRWLSELIGERRGERAGEGGREGR